MSKLILFNEKARKKLLSGTEKIATPVAESIGPLGLNTAMSHDDSFGLPLVTNDGITIAQSIDLEDPFENLAAMMLREASLKTNEACGDGTSTSMVLAQAIIVEGMKNIAAGANPILMREGIREMTSLILQEAKKHAIPVDSIDMLEKVATISSGNPIDGKLIAEAIEKASNNGVISIQESADTKTVVEEVVGTEFDTGYTANIFVSNPDKLTAEINNALILITDDVIVNASQLMPMFQVIGELPNASLVIIAPEVKGQALQMLLHNKIQGNLDFVVIEAPGYGGRQADVMTDIAIITGGSFISETNGKTLADIKLDDLGRAEQIISYKDRTVIVNGGGQEEKIKARAEEVKTMISQETSPYVKERLQTRLRRLVDGAAIIKVGAPSEWEMKEKKLRLEDALNATSAAKEEGILPGGGTMYVQIAYMLKDKLENFEGDAKTGARIVLKALEAPLDQIVENAGKDGSVVIRDVQKAKIGVGYDALKDRYVDMVDFGIIDPAKVTRCALEHASSVAATMLTTKSIVVNKVE